MAKAVVNPQAELPPRSRDVRLTEESLAALGVFASLKKSPSFAKFPGTCVLRHYRAGEVICRQGESGGTAFYLLTSADVDALSRQAADQRSAASSTMSGEVQRLLQRSSGSHGGSADAMIPQPRRLATARLVDTGQQPRFQGRSWLRSLLPKRDRASRSSMQPATIANDGPADIDYQTRQAALYEGEVFGEMSCLMRQPRSATVVVDVECFVLEFLRNILEQMRKDSTYNVEADKKYRERVLENHLRQLPLFQSLNEKEFRLVKERVELVRFAPGSVIWDQGDPSDAVYVVRSGIVQVLESFPWRLTEESVSDWPRLLKAIQATTDAGPAIARLRSALPKDVQETLAATDGEPPPNAKLAVIRALNELAKADSLLAAKEMQPAMSDPRMARETAAFPPKVKLWTGLQIRRANRVLYHVLFSDLVLAAEPAGLARVMQYLARGSIVGEIGVVRKKARTATCVAYAHPQMESEATDVELVRVPAEVIYEIEATSKRMRAEFEKLIASREQRSEARSRAPLDAFAESGRAEDLGLLQGQNLMLIDLDRCTRCGDCVEACIDTHDDGYSRLFLDGPRYGKYVIPSSCRQCRDPVCMIGCPVGSIQQGNDGEIQIREWCIGCGLCANQCPYDSIQMHDEAVLPAGAPGGCGATTQVSDLRATGTCLPVKKRIGGPPAPFLWGIEMHQAISSKAAAGGIGKVRRLYFRTRFRIERGGRASIKRHRLLITSQGSSLEVCLNGLRLELTQDAAQKKRFQFVADTGGDVLRPRENLLAIAIVPPAEFNATVLDARVDALGPESDDVEVKLVTERAVVCDQCSSLSGGRHACVYACPHEAAMRVDSWTSLPSN